MVMNKEYEDESPRNQDVQEKLAQIAKDDPALDPYEINFREEFLSGRGPREPFVNEYGVVIGDHMYDSPESPLNNWSKDTDPAVMSGDQWVHPFKDIGFHTRENRDYFERGIKLHGGMFMHPNEDAAYRINLKVNDEDHGSEEQDDQ